MPFTCICPHCQAPLEAPDHYQGVSVKCPTCQQEYTAAAPKAKPQTEMKGCRGCMVVLAIFIAFIAIMAIFGPRADPSDAAKRNEAWRLQKLEKARVKNYIENIKPYVPK